MSPRVSLLCIFSTYLLLCKAQFEVKKCVDIPGMANFNLAGISGNWLEIKRYTSFYEDKDCAAFVLNAREVTTWYSHYSTEHSEVKMHFEGKLVIGNDPEDLQKKIKQGQASVIFTGHQTEENYANRVGTFNINFEKPTNYSDRILSFVDTDYKSYIILYACRANDVGLKKSFLWILSKDTQLSPEIEKKTDSFLKKHDISEKELVDVGKKCYAQS